MQIRAIRVAKFYLLSNLKSQMSNSVVKTPNPWFAEPVKPADKFDQLENFAQSHEGWIFRGHGSPDWKLETTLERESKRCNVDPINNEKAIWFEFRRHAHSYLSRLPEPTDTIEWLALMQHYGAPTRLLDFTQSFWIAVFFAFEAATADCAVVALNPSSLAANDQWPDYNPVL